VETKLRTRGSSARDAYLIWIAIRTAHSELQEPRRETGLLAGLWGRHSFKLKVKTTRTNLDLSLWGLETISSKHHVYPVEVLLIPLGPSDPRSLNSGISLLESAVRNTCAITSVLTCRSAVSAYCFDNVRARGNNHHGAMYRVIIIQNTEREKDKENR
jgi:hypothetical protein